MRKCEKFAPCENFRLYGMYVAGLMWTMNIVISPVLGGRVPAVIGGAPAVLGVSVGKPLSLVAVPRWVACRSTAVGGCDRSLKDGLASCQDGLVRC